MGLRYRSATTFTVDPLGAWAEDGTNNVSNAARQIVDLTAAGVPLGTDAYVSPGTVTVLLGSPAIAGGGGNGFFSAWGGKVAGLSVQFTAGSAIVTDTSGASRWLTGPRSENLRAGDLIGRPIVGQGYAQIASVDSDTQVTLAFNYGTTVLGAAVAIEQPTMLVGSVPPITVRIIQIQSDTQCAADQNFPVPAAGAVATIGAPLQGATTSETLWLHAWACHGDAGSTVIASTQRTVPLNGAAGLAGYLTDVRRLGALRSIAGPVLTFWTDQGSFQRREVQWEVPSAGEFKPLIAGAAVAWTLVDLRRVVAPTSTLAKVRASVYKPAVDNTLSLATWDAATGTAFGDPALTRPASIPGVAGSADGVAFYLVTDGNQRIGYVLFAVDANTPGAIDVFGFVEELGP